jgi:hypothetical protein
MRTAIWLCGYGKTYSAVAAAGPSATPQALEAEDASGTAIPRVSFRHAVAPAPDAQAGPP